MAISTPWVLPITLSPVVAPQPRRLGGLLFESFGCGSVSPFLIPAHSFAFDLLTLIYPVAYLISPFNLSKTSHLVFPPRPVWVTHSLFYSVNCKSVFLAVWVKTLDSPFPLLACVHFVR